ncbi:MAG: hypothetical protein R6V67_09145, partial [Spirochaetia bacterium]
MNIAENITRLIGSTPLVRIQKLNKDTAGDAGQRTKSAEVAVKLESFNPLSSVKDRVGLAMIEEAERQGFLQPGS